MKKKRQLPKVSDELELDRTTATFWLQLSINPVFHKILEYASSKKGEYSENKTPSEHAHIQHERAGGLKAWLKLTHLLLNPPSPEKSVTEETTQSIF